MDTKAVPAHDEYRGTDPGTCQPRVRLQVLRASAAGVAGRPTLSRGGNVRRREGGCPRLSDLGGSVPRALGVGPGGSRHAHDDELHVGMRVEPVCEGQPRLEEEQQSPYAASRPGLPDFNPRGCQKGGCATNLMYSPSRVRYPLRRVGERGEGRWERVSWDAALVDIARAIVDAIEQEGPASIICEQGPNIGAGPNTAAGMRFFRLLGSPTTDSMAQIGDLSTGATITLGNGHPCGSSDDWWRSAYLVLWAFNPVSTRIPDAHYVTEARYRGAQVITISPDHNSTAFHSDLWINRVLEPMLRWPSAPRR